MEILFKINRHMNFEHPSLPSHFTVTPIHVIRRGIADDCFTESITAIDTTDGHSFYGSPGNYYTTEEEAWEKIKEDTENDIENQTEYIEQLTEKLEAWKKILQNLKEKKI